MTDSKLFVFGSFSEDETKLLLKQSPGKPSPVKGRKPVETNVLQFGSIKFDESLAELNRESGGSLRCLKVPRKLEFVNENNKHNGVKTAEAGHDNLVELVATPKQNGCANHYNQISTHSNQSVLHINQSFSDFRLQSWFQPVPTESALAGDLRTMNGFK